MFLAEEDIKADIKAGMTYQFSFTTGLAHEWDLLTALAMRWPDTALESLKSDLRAGRCYGFDFETALPPDWFLKAQVSASRPYGFSFQTEFAQDWLLRTELKAKRLITLSFTTAFDSKERRLGEERLELYRTGRTDNQALVIPVNWIQKGVDRTWSLDVWFARRQEADPAEEVRMEAFALGPANDLGKEIIDNGYLQAKLSTSLNFEPLIPGTYLNLGPMRANTKKTVDFRLSVPDSAASMGLIFVGLRLEFLRSVVYGSTPFGRVVFGELRRKKPELVLVKIHIYQ
jgi:hypothetical protein